MKAIFEKIEHPDELPFLLKAINLPTFNAPFHFHPEVELTLILESIGRRYVGDHVGNFEAGDLVLIGKDLPHFWHNSINPKGQSQAIVLQFKAHFLGSTFFEKPGLRHLMDLLKKAQRGISIKGKANKLIQHKLIKLKELSPFDATLEVLSILNIISCSNELEFLSSLSYTANFNQMDCNRINAICQYVTTNYAEEINLNYVATKVANMSISAFCHYFRKKMNKTFTQFVNKIRIEEACKLLLETNQEVASICFQCGYQSLSNFYKQFQFIKGLPPNQYRKQHHWKIK